MAHSALIVPCRLSAKARKSHLTVPCHACIAQVGSGGSKSPSFVSVRKSCSYMSVAASAKAGSVEVGKRSSAIEAATMIVKAAPASAFRKQEWTDHVLLSCVLPAGTRAEGKENMQKMQI